METNLLVLVVACSHVRDSSRLEQTGASKGEVEDSKSGKRFNELYKIGKEVS
jgi:hypothetical protein